MTSLAAKRYSHALVYSLRSPLRVAPYHKAHWTGSHGLCGISARTCSDTSSSVQALSTNKSYRSFIIDLQGALLSCGEPVPGARRMLAELQRQELPFVVLTNEDRDTTTVLLDKIQKKLPGVQMDARHIFTAGESLRLFFEQKFENGWRGSIYVIGEPGLLSNLQEVFVPYAKSGSFVITLDEACPPHMEKVDYVIVGSVYHDTKSGHAYVQSVERACTFVQAGAKVLSSCMDYLEVDKEGQFKFGSPGPTVETLQAVTGSSCYTLGKPNPKMLRAAVRKMVTHYCLAGSALKFSDVLFIGDSLETDLRTALEHDIDCALVLNGTTSRADVARSPLDPTFVFESIADVHHALREGDLSLAQRDQSQALPISEVANVEEPVVVESSPSNDVMSSLTNDAGYRCFIFDMDGVIQRFGVPIPGADHMLSELQKQRKPFLLLTNEDRYTNRDLLDRLHQMLDDVRIDMGQLFTAANAVRIFFERKFARGWQGSVYVIGEEGLLENVHAAFSQFAEKGSTVLTLDDNEPAGQVDFVVVGSVYAKTARGTAYVRSLERACSFVRLGAKVLCSCPDDFEVTDSGEVKLGSPGPTVRALQKVTGSSFYSLGKPNPHMLRAAWRQMIEFHNQSEQGLRFSNSLFVGDSLGTDIQTALEHDIDCALVLSGTTTKDKLDRSPLVPTFVFDDIAELHRVFVAGKLRRGCRGHVNGTPKTIIAA